jgi:site-specific DNA recombinase
MQFIKQAIIYCRFSPRPDAETSTSNEKQEERCRAYCARLGYEIVSVSYDRDISGAVLTRPGLSEVIDALAPGMVLVVDTGDRLARDMLIELTIRHYVENEGCTIEYADGTPNCSTPEGKLFRGILSAFSQYDRERFAARTKAGLKKKRDKGEWHGRPPIGFRYDKKTKKLIENPIEKEAVSYIKNSSQIGYSSQLIANKATSLYGNFRGKPWSARTVRKILASQ